MLATRPYPATADDYPARKPVRYSAVEGARTGSLATVQLHHHQGHDHERLQNRIHAIYIDKLDGRIDLHFFEKLSADMRAQQDACLREIGLHQAADQDYLEEGARLLDLAQGAARLFAKQDAHQKRRLLNFVLSNSTWKGGELSVRFRQPFDLLAETTAIIATDAGSEGLNAPRHSGWLGDLDTPQSQNLRKTQAKSAS